MDGRHTFQRITSFQRDSREAVPSCRLLVPRTCENGARKRHARRRTAPPRWRASAAGTARPFAHVGNARRRRVRTLGQAFLLGHDSGGAVPRRTVPPTRAGRNRWFLRTSPKAESRRWRREGRRNGGRVPGSRAGPLRPALLYTSAGGGRVLPRGRSPAPRPSSNIRRRPLRYCPARHEMTGAISALVAVSGRFQPVRSTRSVH